MTSPWYRDFFTEAFWAVARHEYTAQRTEQETEYLAAVLDTAAPGRRVLDLGCGTGRHSVALAARGFRVTGIDVNGRSLRQARAAAEAAEAVPAAVGPPAWVELDLLRELPWPVGEFDAVICVQSFGWGSDAQQLRMLREAHRVLAPGGLLILDHSSVLGLAGRYQAEATFETEGLRADFHRRYDVTTGRSAGAIDVRRDDRPTVVIRDDVRLYTPAEIAGLLERAGFAVEQVDAEFTRGRAPDIDSRYVQFLARKRSAPPAAIGSWQQASPGREGSRNRDASDHRDHDRDPNLDLRWTPDEFDFVREAVERAFDGLTPDAARAYHVADPFAAEQAAPVLSAHFGVDLPPACVTAGSGATGLLQALAALAVPGPVLHLAGGHPDLPRWAAQLGVAVVRSSPGRLVEHLDRHTPALLVLDRPSVTGVLQDPAAVEELAAAARSRGTVVVLDEAYANYAGPSASCAPAVARHDNLVVLRSLSKGYCCGGMRIGFALAAPELTRRIREFAPPLAANSAGLGVALSLLGQGDVFAGLRRRIAEVKPEVSTLLRRAGLRPSDGAPFLPWLTVPADEQARALIEKRSLRVKAVDDELFKISVPLSEERLAAFRAAFADHAQVENGARG